MLLSTFSPRIVIINVERMRHVVKGNTPDEIYFQQQPVKVLTLIFSLVTKIAFLSL